MDCYGRRTIYLANIIRREVDNIDSILSIKEISGTNSWILIYLYHSENPVFQRDLERHFGITRSTASKVISLMEKKDLIIRESNEEDGRLKSLKITDKAKELVERVESDLSVFENKLTKDISNEELNTFLSVLSKMEKNLVGGEE